MLTAVHNSGPETFIRVLCGSCVRETRYCSVIGSAFLKAQSEFIDSSNAAFPESEMIHFRKPVDHPLMLPQPNVCSFSPSFHPHVKSLCGECGGAGPATWMSQSQQVQRGGAGESPSPRLTDESGRRARAVQQEESCVAHVTVQELAGYRCACCC